MIFYILIGSYSAILMSSLTAQSFVSPAFSQLYAHAAAFSEEGFQSGASTFTLVSLTLAIIPAASFVKWSRIDNLVNSSVHDTSFFKYINSKNTCSWENNGYSSHLPCGMLRISRPLSNVRTCWSLHLKSPDFLVCPICTSAVPLEYRSISLRYNKKQINWYFHSYLLF